jgi:hypothetical protein
MLSYQILLHVHSVLRYFVLVFMLISIVSSIRSIITKQTYLKSRQKLNLITMAMFHTQFLMGSVLYFLSPKVQFRKEMLQVEILRFFTLEHVSIMIVAMVLITIGYSKAKKNVEKGNKKIAFYYSLALILVLLAIPWPFRVQLVGGWF